MKRRRCGGFTLAEVSVSMVILVILVGVSVGVTAAGMQLFWRNAAARMAQQEGNAVYALLCEKLSCAVSLTVDTCAADAPLPEDTERIVIASDAVQICRQYGDAVRVQSLYDAQLLHGHTIQAAVTADAQLPALLHLEVRILAADGTCLYTHAGVIPLLNAKAGEVDAFVILPQPADQSLAITYRYCF